MKLLLKANCPTNEYWQADLFCVDIYPDGVARLLSLRNDAIAFLKRQQADWGHVELPSPISFSVSNDENGNELLNDEEFTFTDDKFILSPDNHIRTELHIVKISLSDLWLHAVSKDSADYVEAELPMELLCGKFFLPFP